MSDLRILSEINIMHNSVKLIEIATNASVYYTLIMSDSVSEMILLANEREARKRIVFNRHDFILAA